MDHPEINLMNGDYVAIDLDENNRYAREQWQARNPDIIASSFGWGVCRHGHGLQDLPPMCERAARALADRLNEGKETDRA